MDMNAIRKFLADEEGATAIEYALIAGLIAATIATVLGTMGTSMEDLFTRINTVITGAGS
jgi:pilus assembly protein Flp/PilA